MHSNALSVLINILIDKLRPSDYLGGPVINYIEQQNCQFEPNSKVKPCSSSTPHLHVKKVLAKCSVEVNKLKFLLNS